MSCPCLRLSIFKVDWPHTVDLGVGADVAGNVCLILLCKLDGTSQVGVIILVYSSNNYSCYYY